MLTRLISKAPLMALGGLLSLLLAIPLSAQAGIDDAFDNLLASSTNVSFQDPGRYSSQARNSFVGGGMDIRFPTRRAPTLVSVTPMNLNVGCGGISAHFGGFSFISGEEIKQLIQNVAQNSVGVAIELVMTTLCGPCAHVMQVMRALAKDAAKTAMDSCQMARALISRSPLQNFGSSHDDDDKVVAICAGRSLEEGADPDWLASTGQGLCEQSSKAVAALENFVNRRIQDLGLDPDSPDAQEMHCRDGGPCNTVWTMLNQTDLAPNNEDNNRAKVLLMNVIGTNVRCGSDTECQSVLGHGVGEDEIQRNATVITFPPQLGNTRDSQDRLNMQDVFTLYMCGTNWPGAGITAAANRIIEQYCAVPEELSMRYAAVQFRPIWDCVDYAKCLTIKRLEIGESMLKGNGYLPKVVNLMQEGIEAIRTNNPIPNSLIQLIQASPVPLYQAINAAAVYPDAGGELLAVMSTYVAQLMVYADIREVIRQAERFDKSISLSADDLDRIYSFLGGMRATMERAQVQLGQAFTMQQQLMEQIRQINLAMQREVLSEELLGPTRFSTTLNSAAQDSSGVN